MGVIKKKTLPGGESFKAGSEERRLVKLEDILCNEYS